MACINPRPVLDLGLDENGKHKIKFLPVRADTNLEGLKNEYGDMLMFIPCGKCIECKKKYAEDWATRCYLEAQLYRDNLFVTLTYCDACYPPSEKHLKKDFQKFVRATRDRGFKFRYFGCGERGEEGDRMHLHIIMFGFNPGDLKPIAQNGNGDYWFSSKIIESIWRKGHVTIGLASYETARYTAGYTAGVDKKTIFTLSSRKPAIGYDYYYANRDKFYETDSIVIEGRCCPVPRSFDNLAKKDALPQLDGVKMRRRMISDLSVSANRRENKIKTLDDVYSRSASNIKAKLERRTKKGV